MASFREQEAAAFDAVSRHRHRQQLLQLNAYDRHKRYMQDLVQYYRRNETKPTATAVNGPHTQQHRAVGVGVRVAVAAIKTDEDVLKESYRFIRTEEDDGAENDDAWEVKLAKKYYARLFKEYAIADFSQASRGQIGMRWRTQSEVVAGRGQFTCGARGCERRQHDVGGLTSIEVPFGYVEAGEKKEALVKVRLCEEHAEMLYRLKKTQKTKKKDDESESDDEEKRRRRKKKKKEKKKRRHHDSTSEEEEGERKERQKKKKKRHQASADDDDDDDDVCFADLFD